MRLKVSVLATASLIPDQRNSSKKPTHSKTQLIKDGNLTIHQERRESNQAPTTIKLGYVTVGSKEGGIEATHWKQALHAARKPLSMWHSLKPQY